MSQPIQSPSPKFEITERHIPNQPAWNDHANYFAALGNYDDETVAASNITEGYFGEDDISMERGIPMKQKEKLGQILNMTTPICFPKSEKPEQANKMVTPISLSNSRWEKCAWSSIVTQQKLQELPNAGTIFKTTQLKHAVEYAISDSGAT